jgi:hypothetical protein
VGVGPCAIVGEGPDFDRPNKKEPNRLNTGITVVGKRAVIPRGTRIGRNVKVASDVRSSDFATRVVRSGESIEMRGDRRRRLGSAGNGTVTEDAVASAPLNAAAAGSGGGPGGVDPTG